MSRIAEFQPKTTVDLKEEVIFMGPDGITLTDFGRIVHRLVHHQNTLIQIEGNMGANAKSLGISSERRQTLIEERNGLCRETGIDPYLIGIASNQFFQMVTRRLNVMMGKNGSKGFSSNGHE